MKLGRLPVRYDKRTLKLENYLTPTLTPPISASWGSKITQWNMMGNDTIGDCTCAAAGHLEMLWTSEASSSTFIPTDDQILAAYSAISGYIPSNPGTDVGANALDVLKYWNNNGIAGHKICAYISINPKNLNHIRLAIWLFGGVYIGVNITDVDMQAIENGIAVWSDIGGSGDGGHCIPLISYDSGFFTAVTWGKLQYMSPEWLISRCDEAYAVVSPDWIENTSYAPSGVNMEALISDLKAVQS